jgi:hypothetical protein
MTLEDEVSKRQTFIEACKREFPVLDGPLSEILAALTMLHATISEDPSPYNALQELSNLVEATEFDDERILIIKNRLIKSQHRFLKNFLVQDYVSCNLIQREVLEIQSILAVWSIDRLQIDQWEKSQGLFARNYNYAKLAEFLKTSVSLPKNFALPDWSEYAIHSEISHPTFSSTQYIDSLPGNIAYMAIIDFIQHFQITTKLLCSLAKDSKSIATPACDNLIADFAKVLEEWRNELSEQGLLLPEREPYEIAKYPNGVRITKDAKKDLD